MADDDGDARVTSALDSWAPIAPPDGFADRVLAAHDRERARRRRPALFGGLALALAAAALVFVRLGLAHRTAGGTVVATQRTTTQLGDRGVAVAEPASQLTWHIDDTGAAEVEQATGSVFYRVERGEPFVVHTPAGDLRVTGTCFRVEVEPMNTNHKMILSGFAGVAVATTVLVSVYEGHVQAETGSSKAQLAAGAQATLGGDAISADAQASREQLLARTAQQQAQIAALHAQLALAERRGSGDTGHTFEGSDDGRPWYSPGPETLARWAAECHVRTDAPTWLPISASNSRGIGAGEVDDYNSAMKQLEAQWQQLVRSLYIEATGDGAGADTLTLDSMVHEIEAKSTGAAEIRQHMAQERAGLATPPADPSKTSPLERYQRGYAALGDEMEAALGKRFGADRAKQIRGDGWGARGDSNGCPGDTASP